MQGWGMTRQSRMAKWPFLVSSVLLVALALLLPARAEARETASDLAWADVDFTQVVDVADGSDSEAVGQDFDGQPSTDARVASIYQLFLAAYDACSTQVVFPDDVTVGEVRRAFSLVVANEEHYWAAPKYSLSFRDADGDKAAGDDEIAVKATLRYVVSDVAQIPQVKQKVEAAVAEGLALVDKKSMDDYEIALRLHDYVLSKSSYRSGGDVSGYTPYGALVLGSAVCQGYSLSYKLLLKRAGLSCLYVTSSAMNHSWDLVRVKGNWYHVDCTWDDSGLNTHEYFLRSDASFTSGLSISHHDWTCAHATASTDYADRSVKMLRLYNSYTGEHLYTSSTSEKDGLVKHGWAYEGVAWSAPVYSLTPVYRLYNSYTSDHHYTTSKDEYDRCVSQGWNGEGIAWYSDVDKGAALYRLFNPFESVGTHHYTMDASERTAMIANGWKDEDIAWYGMA